MITLLLFPTGQPSTPAGGAKAAPLPDNAAAPAPLPPYTLVLHNDNLNTHAYVTIVLMRVFRYNMFKAIRLMWQAHCHGQAVIWSGAKEEAERKANEVRACGPDPNMRVFGAKPLNVTVEATSQ